MGESVELRIESLAFGGDGVGRIEGKVCFVPFSVPGELLRVRIVEDREDYQRGEIEAVLEKSPVRRTPRCGKFGRCGGCQWQHIEYSAQLKAKEAVLADLMKRIARLEPVIRHIVPSDSEYGYRDRTRLRMTPSELGYLARGSGSLVEVDECPILAPELERRLMELRSGAAGAYKKELRSSERRNPAILELSSEEGSPRERLIPAGRPRRGAGSDDAYAFHQINRFVNARLMGAVAEAVDSRRHAEVPLLLLDLYCGDGNLSLPLAERAVEVIGFDSAEESIRSAAERARRLGYDHVRYERRDVADGLETVRRDGRGKKSSLCIIADPPRAGLNTLAESVAELSPDILIYISCNPPALARDAARLTRGGLDLDYLLPLDMFPQTFHLETLAVFSSSRGASSPRDR